MSRGIAPRAQGVHPTRMALFARPEPPVRVGSDFTVALELGCPHGCEGERVPLTVDKPDGPKWSEVVGLANHPLQFDLKAPAKSGAQTWHFNLAACGSDGLSHEASSMTLTIEVAPHEASLAVWSLPDAAHCGQEFTFKVGASSTAGAVLAGQPVEIRDTAGAVAGRGRLGPEPLPETTGLLWTEIGAVAPSAPGIANWSAHLITDGLALAHSAQAIAFTFQVTQPPRHRVEIRVVDKATSAVIEDAVVRLGAVRAVTDATGCAVLHIADGTFDVAVWKTGYEIPVPSLEAGAVSALTIEAVALPDEDLDAHWRG